MGEIKGGVEYLFLMSSHEIDQSWPVFLVVSEKFVSKISLYSQDY